MAGPHAAQVLDRPTTAPGRASPAGPAAARPPRPGGSTRTGGSSGSQGRIHGLDGLRALAVVAVLVFHLRAGSMPGGYLGVDVFFVVSGFLITSLLLRELAATGRVQLGAFWLRRARRLLPALVVVVLVSVTAARIVGGDLLVDLDRQVGGALTFSTNWREIAAGSSYFTHTAPLLFVTFWSLAVEEQFYLLWPVLLIVLLAVVPDRRRRVGAVVVLAVASALAMAVLVVPGQDPTRVYYGTDTHAFGLMIGAALALAVGGSSAGGPAFASRGWRRWRVPTGLAGLGVLLALVLTLHDGATFAYRGGIVLASLATAAVIASVLGPRTPLVAVLDTGPMRWVGARSYGIYLWHWPVVLVLAAALPATMPDSGGSWATRGLALVLTVALAAATYRWVEEPVRHLGFREVARRARAALVSGWPASRGPRIAAGLAAAMILTTGFAVATAPQESATERAIRAGEAELASGGSRAVVDLLGGDFGMPAGEEITAFGDSIMVTSLGGLNARFPGIDIQAKSIRQWPEGAQVVRDALAAGTVRRAVVLGYGTNAGVQDPDIVRSVIRELGARRMIVLVNVYQYSQWVPETNAALAAIAAEFDNVVLADWAGAIATRTDLLQSDQIHPGVEGGHFYAEVIAAAFEELAARKGANDDGTASRA